MGRDGVASPRLRVFLRAYLKPLVFCASLLPCVYLAWQVYLLSSGQASGLGADPAKAIVLFNGEWALRFMLLTLSVSPLRMITGWAQLARLRRMLGLFAFNYAMLHFSAYVALLLEFRFGDLGEELVERPFITVGFAALLGLLPLALTSNKFMIGKLKKRWQLLHRLVFPIAVLQIVHLFWLTRSDYTEPLMYSAALSLLIAYRITKWQQRRTNSG
jgi:sulfoxide reductase heme-binding subunit YedZ